MFILFVTKCSTENLILTPIPTQCPDLSTKERLTEICKFKRGKPKKKKKNGVKHISSAINLTFCLWNSLERS